MKYDWSWLKPYFTKLDFITQIKKDIKMDEEYITRTAFTEVFVNPTTKELLSIKIRVDKYLV